MPRWSAKIRADGPGRARLVLLKNGQTETIVNLAWSDYADMCRQLANTALGDVLTTVEKHLGEIVWREAQRACGDDAELAKERLKGLGWTEATVKRIAEELSTKVAQRLVDRLPDQEP